MKVLLNGKEIDLSEGIDPNEKELDENTFIEEEKNIDIEDTIEISEDMLNSIGVSDE